MVSVSRITASCVTKSSPNLALTGTGCGSGMFASLYTGCCCWLAVLCCPLVVVSVVAHYLWSQAHPGQDAGHVCRLDLTGQQSFDDGLLVQRVPVLPPDLATNSRAEVIRVVVVREWITSYRVLWVIGRSGGADGEMAQVTKPGQGFRQGALHVPLVDILDDGIPDRTPLLLPVRVFLLQPGPLGLRDACLGFPPYGRTPEPYAEMERMVPGIEAIDELLPVPGLLEAIVLNQAQEFGDDPLLHKFFVRLLTMLQRCVVVHAGTGEDREEPCRDPERLVDDPLCPFGVVLHEDLERRATLLRVTSLLGVGRGDHVGKADIARVQRVGGKHDDLQDSKALFERERQLNGDVYHIRIQHHPVKSCAGCNDTPLIGVIGLERPVELRILGNKLVGQVKIHLGMADFV